MGMGDSPVPYRPNGRAIRDDVIGKEFAPCAMRSCPHHKVIQRYGTGGVANVSIYTCRRCKYHRTHPLHFGVSCVYELESGISPGAKS